MFCNNEAIRIVFIMVIEPVLLLLFSVDDHTASGYNRSNIFHSVDKLV